MKPYSISQQWKEAVGKVENTGNCDLMVHEWDGTEEQIASYITEATERAAKCGTQLKINAVRLEHIPKNLNRVPMEQTEICGIKIKWFLHGGSVSLK